MEDQAQDVTQTPEVETGIAPSSENETAQVAQTDESAANEQSKYVPYSRFTEVNEGYKQAQQTVEQLQKEVEAIKSQFAPKPSEPDPQQVAIKQQLEALGFITKEQQEMEMRRQREDQKVQAELTQLENEFNGQDGRPKFDRKKVITYAIENQLGNLRTAYKEMHEQELINWHIEQAIAKSKGVKSEASNGSGSSEAGTTNEDLKEAIRMGDKNALKTFLKRQFINN